MQQLYLLIVHSHGQSTNYKNTFASAKKKLVLQQKRLNRFNSSSQDQELSHLSNDVTCAIHGGSKMLGTVVKVTLYSLKWFRSLINAVRLLSSPWPPPIKSSLAINSK
ncbi:hypothetical protein E2542_SST12473 [Spatholobus suberectus]|nr:hypothetical protein E2542_SST12473 [Spatholobus suberectus]